MKKKILCLLISCSMISVSASSQTIKVNIDKAHSDKNAKINSGKADVLIRKRSIVYDSMQASKTPEKLVIKPLDNISVKKGSKIKRNKSKYRKKAN